MNTEILQAGFDSGEVALSFLVSVLGAFAALSAAMHIGGGTAGRRVNWLNAALAGLALGGVGIWSMHFIGMLAYEVPLAIGYRWLELVVSLVAAVVVSGFALGYMAAGPFSWKRLFIAGPLAGLGVTVMHYLGMAGMSFGGYFDWSVGLVALSVAIAVVAATAALWLAFHARRLWQRGAASLVMGAAVCSMHYTGMAAATLVCTTASRNTFAPGVLRPSDLLLVVAVLSIGVAALVAFDAFVQRITASAGAQAAGRAG